VILPIELTATAAAPGGAVRRGWRACPGC